MKLFRKKIGDDWNIEPAGANYPYISAESNPDVNLWHDVSSIESWDKYGVRCRDYKATRAAIIELYIAKGVDETSRFAACNEAEKDIVCLYIVAGGFNRVTRVGPTVDKSNYKKFGLCMVSSREARIQEAMLEIGYTLGVQADIEDLFSELREKIESHKQLNKKDLKEWINSEGVYSSSGFNQKSYFTQAVADIFNNIVELGIYAA